MKYGLLGYPLSHSYSPKIHSKFGSYPYELFEVEPSALDDFFANSDFSGINVTAPYKKKVMAYCDELTPCAKLVGCVNTIVRAKNGKLIGHNTDYYGFSYMLNTSGISVRGKKVLVLGSGGAASTVFTVLTEMGATPIIISRTGENNYATLDQHKDAVAIVNATPVGMYPDTLVTLVNPAQFPNLVAVLDLIYNPARTKLLMEAEALGIITVNGLGMLVAQAKQSAEWFIDTKIPDETIQSVQQDLIRESGNIILVGMPGCGKSTIGRKLAEQMQREFVDLDEVIAKQYGVSPAEMIRSLGEDYFRQVESTVIKEYGKRSFLVIATGGGCVTRPENYAPLHQNGTIIWLQRDINLLETQGRPLSTNTNLSQLYCVRQPMYARYSDFQVSNNGSVDKTVAAILLLEGIS